MLIFLGAQLAALQKFKNYIFRCLGERSKSLFSAITQSYRYLRMVPSDRNEDDVTK